MVAVRNTRGFRRAIGFDTCRSGLPGELGKQTELAADVPVGFGVKLILAVLAANDPGLGFGTGEQAELVVLMEQADVGARGSIVASAQVVVDFKVGGGDGKGLGLVAKAPAAASSALEIGRQDPIVASIRAAATKTYLPGQWREKRRSAGSGSGFPRR